MNTTVPPTPDGSVNETLAGPREAIILTTSGSRFAWGQVLQAWPHDPTEGRDRFTAQANSSTDALHENP